jgi:hypothetical protein
VASGGARRRAAATKAAARANTAKAKAAAGHYGEAVAHLTRHPRPCTPSTVWNDTVSSLLWDSSMGVPCRGFGSGAGLRWSFSTRQSSWPPATRRSRRVRTALRDYNSIAVQLRGTHHTVPQRTRRR